MVGLCVMPTAPCPAGEFSRSRKMSFKKPGRAWNALRIWVGLGGLIGMLMSTAGQASDLFRIEESVTNGGDQRIELRAEGVRLDRLLEEIETRSGIVFDLNDEVRDDPIRVDIIEPDWTSVVLDLLQDYNQVHVWASASELKRVYLLDPLESPEIVPGSAGVNPALSAGGPQSSPSTGKSAIKLTKTQLQKIAGGAHRSPLNEEIFNDPEIRKFLAEHGMKSREDRTDLRLAMKIRKAARKALWAFRKKR